MNPDSRTSDLPAQVGLFGGTFNPIHNGHLQMAEAVLRQYRLEWIYIIPSAQPPHKSSSLASASDRYRMVQLALEGHPRLLPSDIEIKRTGFSYTIDTLRHFRDRLQPGGKLYFLLGADAFLEIHTWKSYQNLFDEAAFIVLPRRPAPAFDTARQAAFGDYVMQRISAGYSWNRNATSLHHPRKLPIHLAAVDPIDVSSTQIRQSIREGRPVGDKLTTQVQRFIMEKGLYQ